MNLVLIGLRGSGKTAVGEVLARKLGRPLVDTDRLVVERAGCSIREIFERQGQAAFRDLEAAVVAEVGAADGQVISVGGGAVLRAENVAALKRHGRLIWLTASPERLWERISGDASTAANRPNLTQTGGLEEIRQVAAARDAAYRASADLIVDTEGLTPEGVADEILRLIGTEIS